MIKNEERAQQIEEFIDNDHKVAIELDELLNSDIDMSIEQLKRYLERMIDEDPLYFDPYLLLCEFLMKENKLNQARNVLRDGFRRVMERIVDKDGKWPRLMEWAFIENRHIIRIINRWGMVLWDEGKREDALAIFRKLLKSNPSDNIGARYSILAIRMNLDSSYTLKFQASLPGFMDVCKVAEWFEENSKKFPEEFDWWWKEIEEDNREIYQLKISIKYFHPPIWRRILITSDSTFADLHDAIQESFNWGNYHLHEFNYNEKFPFGHKIRIIGLNIDGEILPNQDYNFREDEILLYEVFSAEQKSVNYVYDFGDNWEHQVKLEKVFPYVDELKSPSCVGGKRATPPEDCGGIHGYERILKIQDNPKHTEYKETIEWLGGKFNPEQMKTQIKKITPREIERKYGFKSEEKISEPKSEKKIKEFQNDKDTKIHHLHGKTFDVIFHLFVMEKGKRLKQDSLKYYQYGMNLLKSYLNKYGFNYLTDKENNYFYEKEKENSKITFCNLFGSDFLDRFGLNEFLNYFLPNKVMAGKTTFKNMPRVLNNFMKWLHEKGGIDRETLEDELENIEDFKELTLEQILDEF